MKVTGTEAFDRDDLKTPRIVLLQGLSPQLEVYDGAKKDQFFHTGMNVSLGKEFTFIPIIANKRVILWKPRVDGGGILAFSRDGKAWDPGHANTEHEIKIGKEKIKWNTKESVLASGLTRFGSSDPSDPRSSPAASIVYEYLCFLPDHRELSPCVLGIAKTGVTNAKQFNTLLYTKVRQGQPTYSFMIRCFTEQQSNEKGTWTVPAFEWKGYVPDKAMFEECRMMAETLGDYQTEYKQETDAVVDDSINY